MHHARELASGFLCALITVACADDRILNSPEPTEAGRIVPAIHSISFVEAFELFEGGVTGVNENGQVVGFESTFPLRERPIRNALLWENGVVTRLDSFGGRQTVAKGINSSRQIVGCSETVEGVRRAVLWDAQLQIMDLGLPTDSSSCAEAINDFGQIAGSYLTDDGARAFLWTSGHIVDLASPNVESRVADINNAGQVVGSIWDAINGSRAFLWSGGSLHELEMPSGVNVNSSFAAAINDAGQVVGSFTSTDFQRQTGFLWENGSARVLPSLKDMGFENVEDCQEPEVTNPTDIDEAGRITGSGCETRRRPIVIENGLVFPLAAEVPSPSIESAAARAISENGLVVGQFGLPGLNETMGMMWIFVGPVQQLEELQETIDSLKDSGSISEGQWRRLSSLVTQIIVVIEDERVESAKRILVSLQGQIENLVGKGDLTGQEGEPLIRTTRNLIEMLGGL